MTVFEVLREQLKGREETLKNALCGDHAASYDEYRYMTGQLRGLAVAHNLVKDLETLQYESDDDD